MNYTYYFFPSSHLLIFKLPDNFVLIPSGMNQILQSYYKNEKKALNITLPKYTLRSVCGFSFGKTFDKFYIC